jgi:hypothetical protein
MRSFKCFAALAVLVAGCAGEAPAPAIDDAVPAPAAPATPATPAADTSLVPLSMVVDSLIPPAVAGESGWNYRQGAESDLDGDGTIERVVLTARVELVRGRSAWDDGQPWQVYIESADGRRTYVYAQRLQLGTLSMRVSLGEAGRPATIVLVEHLPDRLSLYEVSYAGPDRASVARRFQRMLDPRGETSTPQLP